MQFMWLWRKAVGHQWSNGYLELDINTRWEEDAISFVAGECDRIHREGVQAWRHALLPPVYHELCIFIVARIFYHESAWPTFGFTVDTPGLLTWTDTYQRRFHLWISVRILALLN